MTKRKADYPQAEAEFTPGTREPVKGATEEEITSGSVADGSTPPGHGEKGMEAGLFEDLAGSVREAGAIPRGEREAARRRSSMTSTVLKPTRPGRRPIQI